jgi:hypothetical protein
MLSFNLRRSLRINPTIFPSPIRVNNMSHYFKCNTNKFQRISMKLRGRPYCVLKHLYCCSLRLIESSETLYATATSVWMCSETPVVLFTWLKLKQ